MVVPVRFSLDFVSPLDLLQLVLLNLGNLDLVLLEGDKVGTGSMIGSQKACVDGYLCEKEGTL